jgi:hypothetical protein
MADLTATTVAWDVNSSERTVETQKLTIVANAMAPARGCTILVMALS